MSVRQHYSRRFRFQRLLQASLALGGFFNLGLGLLLGLAPRATLAVFDLTPPEPGFYLELLALLAALLGCYYLLASSDVRRHSGIITLAIAGRLFVALALAFAAARSPEFRGLWFLCGVEALFGVVHSASWWSIRT